MEINGNRLILLALVGTFIVSASFYFVGKSNISDSDVNALSSSIEDNKNNINIIKQNIDKLLAASNTTNVDSSNLSNEQLSTTNNDIQTLMQRYEGLSSELQAIKQKSLQAKSASKDQALQTTEVEKPAVSLEEELAANKANKEEEERKYAERMQQEEEEWQAESVDTIASTEIQGELERIFPSDVKGLKGASSECRSSGCKITLDITDDFAGSPIPMLLDRGSSFFDGKDFIVDRNIDSETGQIKITISVVKGVNSEEG